MIFKSLNFKKTAAVSAVFCFIASNSLHAQENPGRAENSLNLVKNKAVNLLMQSQKKQALSILSDFIAKESNRLKIKEARDLRLSIAKKFLTRETQEAYEMSLNLTIENPKTARKYNEACLASDPENLECLIQKFRLAYREKRVPIKTEENEVITKYFDSTEINWIKLSSEKMLPEFKSYSFFKKDTQAITENKFVLAVLEIERSLAAKNFSRAKDILNSLEKDYADWPDHIYFKNKMELESTENKAAGGGELLEQYKSKCKSLNKSSVRKYRYDFDLCVRGI